MLLCVILVVNSVGLHINVRINIAKEKSNIPTFSSTSSHSPPTHHRHNLVWVVLICSILDFSRDPCPSGLQNLPHSFSEQLGYLLVPAMLPRFHPSFLSMVVHSTLISVFHLPHSLKRWSLVCRLPVSHHQHWSESVFFSFSSRKGAIKTCPVSS